jgi:hypothetical protein
LEISSVLREFLVELDFVSVWKKLQNNHSSQAQRIDAFHGWFDALRTQQFLTRIENDLLSSTEQNVSGLLSWGGYSGVDKESDQLELLERLQEVKW